MKNQINIQDKKYGLQVLIVEDQMGTFDALQKAVEKVCPIYSESYRCDNARWYTQAEEKINQNSYDLVLLDHRMPYDDPKCSEDDEDMGNKFFSTLKPIGYGLIDKIKAKNSKTVVVGTSSLSEREFSGFSKPDYVMKKIYGQAEKDLENILKGLKGGMK